MSQRNKVQAANWVRHAVAQIKARWLAVTAGLGSGKTHGKCQWHFERVKANRHCNFSVFVEPIYRLIWSAAIPKYEKVLSDYKLVNGIHYQVLKTPIPKLVFTCLPSKHEIHFLTAERPDMLVAAEYSHGVMDEAGSCKPESFDKFQDRIRDVNAKYCQGFFGGVPTGLNHYSDKFDSDVLDGWDRTLRKIHFSNNGRLVRYKVATSDNVKFIGQYYIDDLFERYKHNPNAIKSFIYGEFASLHEGLAVPSYLPQIHDVEDVSASPYSPIDLTFDFNNRPLAWVAIQKLQFEDIGGDRVSRYVAIDCARCGYGKLREVIIEFASKFPASLFRDTEINVYGDRSGHNDPHNVEHSDFEEIERLLKEAGYRNVNICATRGVMLEADTLEALDRLFRENYFFINKKCTTLKDSFLKTKLKEGQRKIDKPIGETWTHWTDAAKYWAFSVARYFKGQDIKQITGTNR